MPSQAQFGQYISRRRARILKPSLEEVGLVCTSIMGAVLSLRVRVNAGLDPQDLFAFGDVDGVGTEARLQHPLGLVHGQFALHGKKKRSCVVASDTYNHRIKLVDPQKRSVSTLAGNGTNLAL